MKLKLFFFVFAAFLISCENKKPVMEIREGFSAEIFIKDCNESFLEAKEENPFITPLHMRYALIEAGILNSPAIYIEKDVPMADLELFLLKNGIIMGIQFSETFLSPVLDSVHFFMDGELESMKLLGAKSQEFSVYFSSDTTFSTAVFGTDYKGNRHPIIITYKSVSELSKRHESFHWILRDQFSIDEVDSLGIQNHFAVRQLGNLHTIHIDEALAISLAFIDATDDEILIELKKQIESHLARELVIISSFEGSEDLSYYQYSLIDYLIVKNMGINFDNLLKKVYVDPAIIKTSSQEVWKKKADQLIEKLKKDFNNYLDNLDVESFRKKMREDAEVMITFL